MLLQGVGKKLLYFLNFPSVVVPGFNVYIVKAKLKTV